MGNMHPWLCEGIKASDSEVTLLRLLPNLYELKFEKSKTCKCKCVTLLVSVSYC